MENSHDYDIQLTGDNYLQIFDYLEKNSTKVINISNNRTCFLFEEGHAVISKSNILSLFNVDNEISKGMDKIIYANMPLAGWACGGR